MSAVIDSLAKHLQERVNKADALREAARLGTAVQVAV